MSLQIDAVILAGGMARRMGGDDKGLVELNGKAMIEHTIERIKPQVKEILINANRNQTRYAEFGFTVLSDEHTGFLGPVGGHDHRYGSHPSRLSARGALRLSATPAGFSARLLTAIEANDAELAVASDGEREQPVVMLLKPSLRESMTAFLEAGERKIDFWYAKHRFAVAAFADQPNAFVNVNTPEQKQRLAAEINQS
ncbi:MAG: molybdenum cofactor guanylyltransferase [Shewanella xiamenensis]|nr:molybdenum cofactor guanylyltransferase [Shewanella xiamenensis]